MAESLSSALGAATDWAWRLVAIGRTGLVAVIGFPA